MSKHAVAANTGGTAGLVVMFADTINALQGQLQWGAFLDKHGSLLAVAGAAVVGYIGFGIRNMLIRRYGDRDHDNIPDLFDDQIDGPELTRRQSRELR